MDLQDFYVHLRICLEREGVQNEFQAQLAGASENNSEQIMSKPQVVSSKRLRSGAKLETTKEKAMHFQGKIKKVRVNKEGKYIDDV